MGDFTMQTFDIRKIIEDKQNPGASAGTLSTIVDTVRDNPIPVVITVMLLIGGALWLACRGDAVPPPPPAKPTSESKGPEASDNKKENDKKESDVGEKRRHNDDDSQKDDAPKEDAAGG